MTRLNDLQLILLSTAAQRETGSLLPPAPTLTAQGDRIRKAIAQLLKRGLIVEVLVSAADEAWRQDDETTYGVAINAAGRSVLAIDAEPDDSQHLPPEECDAHHESASAPERTTKSAMVLGLLRSAEGATLDELVTATGWLPHTTRAALTGLRKKGHAIERGKRGELSCYRLWSEG